MKLRIFFILLIANVCAVHGQQDSVRHGSIKVAKAKDTLYLLAQMKFDVFLPSDEPVGKSYRDFVNSVGEMQKLKGAEVMEPQPQFEDYTAPFDYTRYFNQKIKVKNIRMDNATDTVQIRVDIRKDGKYYYKNMSRLSRISNKVVIFDERRQAYVVSESNNMSMAALKELSKWQPAYRIVPRKAKLKGTTVIRPEMEKLHASGVLTIIFSKTPLEKETAR